MTTYTGWGSTNPGATWSTDNNAVSLGTAFYVTQPNLFFSGYRLWRITGHNVTGIDFGLFAAAAGTGATGTPLTGTALTSQAPAADGWNEFLAPTPYALTANTIYYAEYHTPLANGGYPLVSLTFTAEVDRLPIAFAANGAVLGGNTVVNGGFNYAASISPVNGSFQATFYCLDIIITTAVTSTPTAAADSFALSEAVTRGALALPRTAADSLAWSEAPSRGGIAQPRAAADSLVWSESLARGPVRMARAVSDSFAWSEAANTGATVLFGTPRHIPSNWGLPRHIPSLWGTPRHV